MLRFARFMFSQRRASGTRLRSAFALALLLPALSACAPAAGGGVLVAVVAIGALTTHCYDYFDVTVFDALGRRTCAATVTASNGSDEFELKSCYYAPLTDGHWTIRAKLQGSADAVSTADVEHANDCTRHVQSMELTLLTPGAGHVAPPALLGAPALPPTGPAALPPPPPPPAGAPAPANSASPPPPASSSAPANPTSPAAPLPPAAPSAPSAPVGVFPDQGTRPAAPPK
jgi:hypothetical protein